jgi:hypothetical protein
VHRQVRPIECVGERSPREPRDVPQAISGFEPNVEDNLGPVVECEWDFGDATPKVKGLNPTHVFEKANDYEVR